MRGRGRRIGDLTEAEGRERQRRMEEVREAASRSIILGEFLRVTGESYTNDDPGDASHRASVRREARRLARGDRFDVLEEHTLPPALVRSVPR